MDWWSCSPQFQPTRERTAHCLSEMLKQSCPDNSLKFICEFKPRPGLPQASDDEDNSYNTDCQTVSFTLSAQCSVYQLRLSICLLVRKIFLDGLILKVVIFHFCSCPKWFVNDWCGLLTSALFVMGNVWQVDVYAPLSCLSKLDTSFNLWIVQSSKLLLR